MAQRAEYKVLQENNANQLQSKLNGEAASGWKPILMTTTHAAVGPGGQGHLIITVILEHVLGG